MLRQERPMTTPPRLLSIWTVQRIILISSLHLSRSRGNGSHPGRMDIEGKRPETSRKPISYNKIGHSKYIFNDHVPIHDKDPSRETPFVARSEACPPCERLPENQ